MVKQLGSISSHAHHARAYFVSFCVPPRFLIYLGDQLISLSPSCRHLGLCVLLQFGARALLVQQPTDTLNLQLREDLSGYLPLKKVTSSPKRFSYLNLRGKKVLPKGKQSRIAFLLIIARFRSAGSREGDVSWVGWKTERKMSATGKETAARS